MAELENSDRGRSIVEHAPAVFEQYRLAVEMADRLSARRGTANGFYFTVSSALLAASESLGLALASIAGIALCAAWWLQLKSYRKLSSAKWIVINAIEQQLPAKPFNDEWLIVKAAPTERVILRSPLLGRLLRPAGRYAELSIVEQVVPLIWSILFLVSATCNL